MCICIHFNNFNYFSCAYADICMRVIVINRSYAIKYLQVLNTNTQDCELHVIFAYLINISQFLFVIVVL